MPYFFCGEKLALTVETNISGEEARHLLLSHRIKIGERVKLQDPDGRRFCCVVKKAEKNFLAVEPVEEISLPAEPAASIVLFQAVVPEKTLDFILQKSTELGVRKIVLFNSANTAFRIKRDDFKKKYPRWVKILKESAKQSERAIWPALEIAQDLKEAVTKAERLDKIFLLDPNGEKISFSGEQINNLGIVVGPEGGLNQEEVKIWKKMENTSTISLGDILLRAETAALAGVVAVKTAYNL